MLYFINIPYNCSDSELRDWIESRGIRTRSIRIIRDLVSGVSPAFGYAEIDDEAYTHHAVRILNGQRLRNHVIQVQAALARAACA